MLPLTRMSRCKEPESPWCQKIGICKVHRLRRPSVGAGDPRLQGPSGAPATPKINLATSLIYAACLEIEGSVLFEVIFSSASTTRTALGSRLLTIYKRTVRN